MKANKNNMIITIDTELGCSGEAVAHALAEQLHIPCYGEEILDKAAELSGISARLMHRYDGRAVHAAYDLLAEDASAIRMRSAADFITAQVLACRELAAQGPCILVDRHATLAMQGREGHVSIFLHADFEDRAARLAETGVMGLEEARKTLRKNDRARRSYYRGSCKGWGEAESYDISVNASDADEATLANTILGFLETMTGETLVEKKARKAV